eukprot:5899123-Pleurochrysis_carterae.AAC.1
MSSAPQIASECFLPLLLTKETFGPLLSCSPFVPSGREATLVPVRRGLLVASPAGITGRASGRRCVPHRFFIPEKTALQETALQELVIDFRLRAFN